MIGCKLGLTELVDIARKEGMRCITAFKAPMFAHNQIGPSYQPLAAQSTLPVHNVHSRRQAVVVLIITGRPADNSS